ncbi:hypothetical protein ATCC90586_008850 [Pythium insidiosum]|nr:hypothetical protein ATCC90586_008850 [Pythium insidiosum]
MTEERAVQLLRIGVAYLPQVTETHERRWDQLKVTTYLRLGLSGQQLRVEGLWRFRMETVYNLIVQLDALLVAGCDKEILLGKDFLRMPTQAYATLKVPIAAPDGSLGVLEPAEQQYKWLVTPRTVAVVRDGHVTVPVLSVSGRTTRLPARGKYKVAPLPNENELDLEHLNERDAELMRRVLRAFPGVVSEAKVCPPLTKTDVAHHIPTGKAAPILHRAWRKSVAENKIVDEHVQKMLSEGVIEMGNGPWGFPVILVKKKDGSVRFCVDYRALNQRWALSLQEHDFDIVYRAGRENVVPDALSRAPHGPFRELLTDGAAELQSATVRQLVVMLQANQVTPVAYRPNLMGLVERFNRVWKDMVAIYVNERQDD